MDIESIYRLWLKNAIEDESIARELKTMLSDEQEKYERFYRNIQFCTAGGRGLMGAGTNRIKIYTVRHARQGLSEYLNKIYEHPSVAVSFDSRNNSKLFAQETARVLAANNIKVYITEDLQPTPVLSYCVRYFKCQAGVMITASHNPAEYNGYKCYGEDGCQMTEEHTCEVYKYINNIDIFRDVKTIEFSKGLANGMICIIDKRAYESYIDKVIGESINKEICREQEIKVTYTPLNGAGNKLVREVLKRIGVRDLEVVKEQEAPDGDFPTCKYPNPEMADTLKLAINKGLENGSDIVIATDPDSDRIGVAVRNKDSFYILNGNEIGILMFNYIISCRKNNGTLPKNPIAVKTLVSSSMINCIALDYGCKVIDVLTGFKNIGEQIRILEKQHEEDRYIFGFEESHGYLSGTYVRDKDAVFASMMVCEMCAYYKSLGKSLFDILYELQIKYGFYISQNISFEFKGSRGMEIMSNIMNNLIKFPLNSIGGLEIECIYDYINSKVIFPLTGEKKDTNLPKSNMLIYNLKDKHNIIIRPSGTEPKIKAYITTVNKDKNIANEIKDTLLEEITDFLSKNNN